MILLIAAFSALSLFGLSLLVMDQLSGHAAFTRERFQERLLSIGASSDKISIEKTHRYSDIKLLQKLLQRQQFMKRMNYLIEITGWGISTSMFILISLLSSALIFFVLLRAQIQFTYALILSGIAVFFIPTFILKLKRQEYLNKFSTNFPKALQVIRGAISAGLGLSTSFERAAEDCPYPVNKEFKRLLRETAMGKNFSESVLSLRDRIPTMDVNTFVVAITIQQESGGNLAELISNLEDTISARVMLRKEMSALTAQAKVSGLILTLLPPIMAVVIMGINPGYMQVLFETQDGHKLLFLAGTLQCIGFFWIKKIVSIKLRV